MPVKLHSSLQGRAPAKEPKGTATTARRRRTGRTARMEALYKAEAKILDHHRCQYPGCSVQGVGRVESAHLENAGMGGRASVGNHPSCFVTACHEHHQGTRSLHTTHLVVTYHAEHKANGPVEWYRRERLDQPFVYVGTSRRFVTLSGASARGTHPHNQT